MSVACSQSATLKLKDGGRVDGKIVDNRRGRVIVQIDGNTYGVPVESVEDVDHPGDGALVAGGIVGGIGSMLVLSTVDACEDEPDDEQLGCAIGTAVVRAYGGAMVLTGIGLAIYGLVVKMSSKRRLQPQPRQTTSGGLGPRREASVNPGPQTAGNAGGLGPRREPAVKLGPRRE